MDGLKQTNKKMEDIYALYYNSVSKTYEFELKKDYKVNDHKTLKAGQVMDVTQEFYQWLDENGYGKKQKIKEKKSKKAQEEQKRIEEENKRIEELNSVQNKLTNPFSLGRKVDTTNVRQATIDYVLPKSFVPEQISSYPEPFEEEPALNRELAEFKKQINSHLTKIGFASGSGGGAGFMGDLDDVDISGRGHKSILMFNDVTSKYEVADPDLDAGISNEDDTGDEIILNATATGGADEGGSIQQENETRMAISDTTVSSLSLSTATLTLTDSASATVTVDLSGLVVDTATEATNITASANNSTNETVYPVFVDGATGTQGLETDTGLNYNPSTGVLTGTQFTGNVTGDLTGNADTFTATANNSTNETVYPVFVDGATGAQGAETDTGLTYNPSTGLITAAAVTTTGDITLGDDLILDSDSAVVQFGDDQEIKLTHVHNQGLSMTSTHDAPLVRRGEDVFIVLNGTNSASANAGDNIVQDTAANDGDDIIGEDEVFVHTGMQRDVINIIGSDGKVKKSIAGFSAGVI